MRICREVFGRGDDFVQKITGNPNVDRPLQRIREFRNRPNPRVVVTVDMLSTGVDIPALEFIVFLRPVKSRILWEQMLGRGTRRCDEINKSRFVVFDCFDGTLIRYFKDASNFRIETPRKDPPTIPEIIDKIWENIDRDYNVKVLVKRLRRIEKDMAPEARALFVKWIPEGDMGQFAASLTDRLRSDFSGTMKILRDRAFQEALADYPRAVRTFWIGHEVRDAVSSKAVDRYGRYDSADDYIEAFARFVCENADEVAALKILLERPKGWRPEALAGLLTALRQNDFDERALQRAHARVFRKDLADIISMVKHAAREQEPLLTAHERVRAAMEKIRTGHAFDQDQLLWLGYIEQHLVNNLCIDEEDFEAQPVFAQRGGLSRARKLFGPRLPALIQEINLAVAA